MEFLSLIRTLNPKCLLNCTPDALPGTRITAVGGVLNVTAARKDDAGRYRLRAANAEGKASIKVRLDVHYQPR